MAHLFNFDLVTGQKGNKMLVTRNVWMKYRNPTNGEGNDLGGGAGGDDAAAKAAADAAAAAKAAEEEAARKAAGDGKTGPSDEEARLLKEVMDKKNKLKAAEDRAKGLEEKLKQFEGIDVDSVKNMLAEKEAKKTKKLEEQGQWEALKKQIVEAHTAEKTALEGKVGETQGVVAKLQAQIAELTVGNSFASSQFIKEEMTMPVNKARALYAAHFEFQDGQVVAYDKASGADRAVLVDAKGDPLGFEAAIKKIIEADPDRDSLIKSKVKTGAGSNTSKKAASPEQTFDQPTGKDRIAAALAKSNIGIKK